MPLESTEENSKSDLTTLLKKYEPVLHFARGERFYPMNAGDFLDDCVLKKKGGWLGLGEHTQAVTDKNLLAASDNHYLHYLYDNRWSILLRIIITVIFTCLIGLIWYSVQSSQFNLRALEGDNGWPQIWEGIDNVKLILVGAFLLSWTVFGGNRQVHFTLFLAMTVILFSGTLIGVGFGLLSIQVIIAIFFIRRGTSFRQGLQRLLRWSQEHSTARIILLAGIIGFGVFLLLSVLLYLVVWSLSQAFNYNRELNIVTILDPLPSILPIPFDFVAMITLVIIVSILGLTLWSGVARFLRNRLKNAHTTTSLHKVSIDEELLPLIVLLFAIIVLVVMTIAFNYLGIYSRDYSHGRSLAFGLLAVTAASAIFWFFIDPFVLIEAKLNPQSEKGQQPLQPESNTERLIFISLIGFLLWFFMNLFLALTRLDQNTFIVTASKLLWLPLIFLTSIIVILLLAIGFSGPQFAGFIMNLLSLEPDSVAQRAKGKYIEKVPKIDENNKPWYHGRVVTDNKWTVLQYHYFYAYNDWRNACDGINQHEGDWEAVAIFLENPKDTVDDYIPFGVACSQHHDGDFRFWENVDRENEYHPKIYVALGSHANYFKAINYPTSMLLPGGFARSLIGRIDSIVGGFRGSENGLPKEVVDGEGLLINQWNCLIITNKSPVWVLYKGLWGKKTRHPDESGPTGPRWNRPEENLRRVTKFENRAEVQTSSYSYTSEDAANPERPRWQLHTWKDMLLLKLIQNPDVPTEKRRKALQHLIDTSEYLLS